MDNYIKGILYEEQIKKFLLIKNNNEKNKTIYNKLIQISSNSIIRLLFPLIIL